MKASTTMVKNGHEYRQVKSVLASPPFPDEVEVHLDNIFRGAAGPGRTIDPVVIVMTGWLGAQVQESRGAPERAAPANDETVRRRRAAALRDVGLSPSTVVATKAAANTSARATTSLTAVEQAGHRR